ncbi:MAG: hypothetical protein WC607_00285 [Candidatus Micrarchaeia archaeon]
MLACFASNRPEQLARALSAYAPQLTGHELLVIDTDATHGENAAKLPANALHYSETEFPEMFPDHARAFQGKYGGVRNQCLAVAAARKQGAVFLDDDTLPLNDVIRRHENALEKGYDIVCGKYLGHAGGSTNLVIQLVNELNQKEPRPEKIKNIFSGLPEATNSLVLGAGVNGGNLGVSLNACRTYAFYPTAYRVEDGTYASLNSYYLGADRVYNPQTRVEAESYLPVVLHKMAPGTPDAFRKKLVNEIQGTSLALAIYNRLEKRESNRTENTDKSFQEYLVAYLQKNSAAKNYPARMPPELTEEKKELEKLLALTPDAIALPEKEYDAGVELFFETQRDWKETVKQAEKKLG